MEGGGGGLEVVRVRGGGLEVAAVAGGGVEGEVAGALVECMVSSSSSPPHTHNRRVAPLHF